MGFMAIASLCKGACWYMDSTLNFDGRQFELHYWNVSQLNISGGDNILTRPSFMKEIIGLPYGNPDAAMSGLDTPIGNIGGMTYSAISNKIYILACPFGDDKYTCRIFEFTWQFVNVSPDDSYHNI